MKDTIQMKNVKILTQIALIAFAVGICVSPTYASLHTINFINITNNGSQDVAAQLTVDIMDQAGVNAAGFANPITLGPNSLLFVYRNVGSIASAVSETYIDNGPVVSQSLVYNSIVGSTTFVGGSANPGNLPGGANLSPPFVATGAFSADAQGNPSLGLNPGEVMGIEFVVNGGFAGVVSGLADGTLRLGMHVRSIGTAGNSDSFVNTSVVPEPGTIAVWGVLALAGAFGAKKWWKVA